MTTFESVGIDSSTVSRESSGTNSRFDYFGKQEKPSITLCNPGGSQLYSLNNCFDTEIILRWLSQSEFTFSFPRTVNGVTLPAYDLIEGKRLVLVDGIGYFVIYEVSDESQEGSQIKTATCLSLEYELVSKRINSFSGTYRFYNPDNPSDSTTLIGAVFALVPSWTIVSIDSSLNDIYRTFSTDDTNVYTFLVEEVHDAYGCNFIFDFLNRTVSILSVDVIMPETDIFLSFDNLIHNTSYEEVSNEITTCMFCYGGGNLSIRNVNPLGTNVIYDFTYYKNTNWMSQGLIDSINAWETKKASYEDEYAALIVSLGNNQTDLLTEQAKLVEYQSILSAHEQVRIVREQAGMDTVDIDAMIQIDNENIAVQALIVSGFTDVIEGVTTRLSEINDALDLENTDNFSVVNLAELRSFMYENTYQNDNIIITDLMTPTEIQEQSSKLYEDSLEALARASVPRYKIEISAVNFLALQEYLPFINALKLGHQITVDSGKGYFIDAILTEYTFSYDDPENFEIILSNRQRSDSDGFIFSDFIGKSISTSTTVINNIGEWSDWNINKPIVVGNILTPSGSMVFGLKATNITGTITLNENLNIKNVNATTGQSNLEADKNGVTLRDPILYADNKLGVTANLNTSDGTPLQFIGGILVSGDGSLSNGFGKIIEILTGQTGSTFNTMNDYVPGTLSIYVNGIQQIPGVTFGEGNMATFTMFDPVLDDDSFVIEYTLAN